MARKEDDPKESILYGHPEPLPQPHHLHRIFEIALRREDAPFFGLHFEERFIPYCEVNRRANIAARELLHYIKTTTDWPSKPKQHPVIAVDIQPCENLVITLVAIMKIGMAYVPVDSTSAINRVRYVLNQADPMCVIVDNRSAFKLDPDTVWSRFHVVDIKDLLSKQSKDIKTGHNLMDEEMLIAPHLLSVIYTSGSTGRPKGVCLNHLTALNRLHWQWETFPFRANEKGCFKTSLLFVDSIVEVFSCVLKLVSLVIIPKEVVSDPGAFTKLLEKQRVSRLTMVPSMLRNILYYVTMEGGRQRLPSLKLWVCNSETLPPNLLMQFFDIFSDRMFCNFYGSTETMADVTYEVFRTRPDVVDKCSDNSLSIGRPMFNSNVYILDESRNLVPPGEVGEVCISGYNVADGYKDGERTTLSFIDNPFSDQDIHHRLYKTGDFGRLYKGSIIFEGRRDTQIKIRGQRVNIAEIEKVILECPCVEKTAVLYHKLSEISSVIVAYYTTKKKEKPTLLETAMFEACKRSLPPYMCPKLMYLDEIPLQPHTGKVDRVALRAIYEKMFNRQSSMEIQCLGEKARKALNIIALNLNIPPCAVPKDVTFFDAGGNSVSMISTLVQLKQYGFSIDLETFMKASSIEDLIEKASSTDDLDGPREGQGKEVPKQIDKYEVHYLNEIKQREDLIDVLTDSFVEKEPLDLLLGVTRCEFIQFARSLYEQAVMSHLSLIVLERETGRVVGGDFLFNYFLGVKVEHHPSMAPIIKLLQDFEIPVKESLRRANPGHLLFNFCLCVHKDLQHAEQVKICHLIEGNVLRVAKENGFAGVVTNNTNPVTQDICEHFFQYELLDKLHVQDYVFNGRKVFSHAPEDFYIKMMVRYV